MTQSSGTRDQGLHALWFQQEVLPALWRAYGRVVRELYQNRPLGPGLEDGGSGYSLNLKALREADSRKQAEKRANPDEAKQQGKAPRKNKPGQRNPARDPIVDPALSAPKA